MDNAHSGNFVNFACPAGNYYHDLATIFFNTQACGGTGSLPPSLLGVLRQLCMSQLLAGSVPRPTLLLPPGTAAASCILNFLLVVFSSSNTFWAPACSLGAF